MKKTLALIVGSLLAAASSSPVQAQDSAYPNRVVRIVVPFTAGDSSDRIARLLAESFQAKWGQTFVVENRPGGGGNIGAGAVAHAPGDGYTLLFTPQFPLVVNKSLYPKLSYDPNVLLPVSIAVEGDMLLLAHPKLNANSVQDVIAAAKAAPEKINYASPGIGSMGHLIGEYFNTKAGVKTTHIVYKGASPALTDLLAGQVEMMFISVGAGLPHINAGKLRAVATTGDTRNVALPGTPLVSDVLPEFHFTYWFGMAAPPGTPKPIVDKLAEAMNEALAQPQMTQALRQFSLRAVGSGPQKMQQVMDQERPRWGSIVETSGAKAE